MLLQILLYNVVKKKGVEPMKLVLKILALPVLFVVKVICVLGNLLTNVVSYVIGIVKRKKKYSVVYTYTDENGNKRQKWESFETNSGTENCVLYAQLIFQAIGNDI